MEIQHNFSLKNYNTFGVDARAKSFVSVTSLSELNEILSMFSEQPLCILSGGSNMLITKDIDAMVIHIQMKGITVLRKEKNKVWVQVQAGEIWHEFTKFCVAQNYGGLENLSLIPGYVGSAPIQNIGAYGVELKDYMHSCEAIHVPSHKKVVLENKDCKFGYRDSLFKQRPKGEYIITSVTFALTHNRHDLHIDYGAIQHTLAAKGIDKPTIREVADAVIAIRQKKLPNPAEIGNSGSFFKNPILSISDFEKLKRQYPNCPNYTLDDNWVKIPAAWLIEKCGFKGKRWGDAGVYKNQALVLVNYGNATGMELFDLAKTIQKTVRQQFGITLAMEVQIL